MYARKLPVDKRIKGTKEKLVAYHRARRKPMNLIKAPQSVSKDRTDHGGVLPGLWHGIRVFQQERRAPGMRRDVMP